jgi:replication factor A1
LTCFNDTVDQFFDLLQVGKVYDFTNFQVKISKRQFGNIKNEYEISADSQMSISVVLEDVNEIPSVHYEFVPIASMANAEKEAIVDVIGVVKEAGELSQITTKTTQKQLNKRDLTIVDMSKGSIRLTLWGKQAEDYANEPAAVIAVKGARVNEYQGRTLSTMSTSTISYNPDIPECHTLRGWFDSHGGQVETTVNVSSAAAMKDSTSGGANRDDRKFLSQVKDENLGMSEKPDYFSVLATVSYIKADQGNISYMACPAENCNKKVVEEGPNEFRCERCRKVFDRCDHRYIMTVQISDPTAAIWVSAFDESGAMIMGRSAEESYHMKMEVCNGYACI